MRLLYVTYLCFEALCSDGLLCTLRKNISLYFAFRPGDFPGGSDGRESVCITGGLGSIPGLGRSCGGGHVGGHSSILAWRIPWKEKPGGLQAMGSQKVGHD